MQLILKALDHETLPSGTEIWNEVVGAGRAFPQTDPLTAETAEAFFAQQTYTGVALDAETEETVGLYILHPNNVGRCGHICNASYAVRADKRGCHIGEALISDCMEQARRAGFRILQFNAVVKSNLAALKLYQKMGFVQLGVIPGGFCNADGVYEDIIPHYIVL